MTTVPRLIRSIPFWALVAVSLASIGVGSWMVADKLVTMESAIVNQTITTGAEVYVGQPAAVVGGVILGAGIVGILLSLAVAAVASLRPQPAIEVVEAIDWTTESDEDDELVAPAPVAEAAEAEAAPADALVADAAEDVKPADDEPTAAPAR